MAGAGTISRSTLVTRLKRAFCASPRPHSLQLVVLANQVNTAIPLLIAAFQQNWSIHFAPSAHHALAQLPRYPAAALVYDWDSWIGDWRELCAACVSSGVPFHLVAGKPPDDLFLAVASAGGSGVLWKPFSSEQIIAAIRSGDLTHAVPDPTLPRVRATSIF
jgi:hypothetical protein